MDRLAELLRTGVTPVLSRYGFRRESRNYSLLTGEGDLLVISFDNARVGAGKGAAADIDAGCFPRYFLERLDGPWGSAHRVPHATMAMLWWKVDAPADASYAPAGERTAPSRKKLWALGEYTSQTARVLAGALETQVVPRLLSLGSAERQYEVIEADWPDPAGELYSARKDWGRVTVRLGRVPRPEVERLLEEIPLDDEHAEHSARFTEWVRSRLDSIYLASPD